MAFPLMEEARLESDDDRSVTAPLSGDDRD
jgi:hypothetical protein